MPSNYIGLATSAHDPALAIVNSKGEVVFAESTERYIQNKRAWCTPPEDLIRIKILLEEYCEKNSDLVIATTWTNKSIYYYKLLFLNPLTKYFFKLVSSKSSQNQLNHLISMLVSAFNPHAGETTAYQKSLINPHVKILKKAYNHHLTHAASACYSSPFKEAVCMILDGIGEGISTSCYIYRNGKIELIKQKKARVASLGFFYSNLCDTCGFEHVKGEEWKVMGLAAYGKFDEDLYKIMRLFLTVKDGVLVNGKDPKLAYRKFKEMRRKPDESPLKAANLAFTGQVFYNDIVIELLRHLYDRKISENLILGGGCALNSSCNGILLDNIPFKNLHIYSAPADDGNAIGAALLAYYDDHPPQTSPAQFQTPYLGAKMSPKIMEHLNTYSHLKRLDISAESIPQKTAELLAAGKIVGWVQGRAEFGPRALGNRSILADPRSPDVKERLNATVKFREEFRPFAPSILHEHGHEYFENYQETPYMERTLRFKKEMIGKVPGVVHVDGTGRLQTVKKEWNPKYHALISAFKEITGIPVVLNTSFNVMGKPIIHSVEDAVAVFLTSGLDALVIEDHLYLKEN